MHAYMYTRIQVEKNYLKLFFSYLKFKSPIFVFDMYFLFTFPLHNRVLITPEQQDDIYIKANYLMTVQ